MITTVRAELALMRRRTVLAVGVPIAGAFAAITTLATFLAAQPEASSPAGRGITLEALAAAGGATDAFRVGTGFLGVLVVVVFAARMASEFSHGTLRTLLVHEPRRWRVVTAKMLAVIAGSAAFLALAAAFSVLFSLILAPGQDVSTSDWFGIDGARAAVGDYLSALAGVIGWGVYGMLLGLVLRSIPVVVAVGVAWAGPFEHLLSQGWTSALSFLPGLQAEALAAGGTTDVSYPHALTLTVLYGTLTITAGLLHLSRHDVTA
jgi:ABC-2 type transport system permease protein